MKLSVTECVSKSETMTVCAGDSIGGCDLKTACKIVLFLCSVATGGSGELAVVLEFDSLETVLLWVCRLAWTRAMLSVCPVMLGARILRVFWVEMGGLYSPPPTLCGLCAESE